MLRARILTAVIVLCLFLAALFYLSAVLWMVLLLALTAAGAWEWSRLARFSLNYSIFYLLFTIFLAGELLFVLGDAVLADPYTTALESVYFASVAFWILYVPLFLKTKHGVRNRLGLALMGWLVLLPTGLALYQLRAIDPLLLLGFMCTIWISDTAAYFSGAPGKAQAGALDQPGQDLGRCRWSARRGSGLCTDMEHQLANDALAGILVPLLLLLTAMGIIGDLFESLMKRQADVKDSGNILPGHGGILDRIDALTSTLPLAILSLLILQSEL